MIENKYEYVDINKLVPYARNARTHTDEQILKIQSSIREFGFINPVLIDDKYNIIAGHGRVEAAKREGLTELPCVFVSHLTEAQKRAYILADNRMALDAGWDKEMLKVEFDELLQAEVDLALTGFDASELENIMYGAEALDLDDDAPENEKQVMHCPKCGFEFEVDK